LNPVGAKARLQSQFTDVDLAAVPPPISGNLPPFASMGPADSNFIA
jgi:hypothetical protein